MILLKQKIPSASNITFFRSILENINGIVGPAIATPKAKPLTKRPAVESETLKDFATKGKIPMIPISVLMIPKTPTVKSKINKSFFFFI